MAPLSTVDGIHGRVWGGFDKSLSFYFNQAGLSSSLFNGAGAASLMRRVAWLPPVPNTLETGVTAYIPTKFQLAGTVTGTPYVLAEVFDMGTLDIATNVFTDGVAAPSRKTLGTTAPIDLLPVVETDTALNSAPGNLQFNYLNQDGNARTSVSVALLASAVIRSAGIPVLAANDIGVTDITSATRSAGTTPTGTIRFLGLSPIYAGSMIPGVAVANVDLINQGIVRRLGAGAKLGLFAHTTAAVAVAGKIHFVGDTA